MYSSRIDKLIKRMEKNLKDPDYRYILVQKIRGANTGHVPLI